MFLGDQDSQGGTSTVNTLPQPTGPDAGWCFYIMCIACRGTKKHDVVAEVGLPLCGEGQPSAHLLVEKLPLASGEAIIGRTCNAASRIHYPKHLYRTVITLSLSLWAWSG